MLIEPHVCSSVITNLEKLDTIIEQTPSHHQLVYQRTCKILQNGVLNYLQEKSLGTIMSFPIQVDSTILSLSEGGDTMARILFIHYGVVLHLGSDRWFVGNSGKRLVMDIAPLIEGDGEWEHVLRWAKMSVGAV
jgi:hypothetical protein